MKITQSRPVRYALQSQLIWLQQVRFIRLDRQIDFGSLALSPHPVHSPAGLPLFTVYIQIFETNILRLLEEHDMTKQELADKAGISISFLSDLTNGKANPSLKIMESIANAFEVPLPYLLESTELSFEELAELRQDSPAPLKPTVPSGYERVSAILPEFQAFQVRQWAEAARKRLRK